MGTDYRMLLSSDRLRAVDLLDKPHVVTIVRVTQGTYDARERGKKPKKMPDVQFREFENPLGCNSTNGKAIAKLLGSTYVEDWIGRKIVIRPMMVDAFGEQKLAIRVDNRLPKDDPGPQRRANPPSRGAAPPAQQQVTGHRPDQSSKGPAGEVSTGNARAEETSRPTSQPMSPEEAAEIERLEREHPERF